MLHYELVIVYDASLDDDAIKGMIAELEKFVTDRKGEILNIDEWGRRRLAYPIRKKENGYYTIVNFALQDPGVLRDLESNLRLNERILRHLILKSRPPKKPSPEKAEAESESETKETEEVSTDTGQTEIQEEKTELRTPSESSPA